MSNSCYNPFIYGIYSVSQMDGPPKAIFIIALSEELGPVQSGINEGQIWYLIRVFFLHILGKVS